MTRSPQMLIIGTAKGFRTDDAIPSSFSSSSSPRTRWTPAKGHTFYSYDPVGNLTFVNYTNSPDTCTPVQVLLDGGSLQPTTVQLDVKNGLYYGAILRYPAEVTLDQARQSLNTMYAKWQKPNFADDQTMGLWRNTEKGFSIQLTREKDAVVVIYISYKLMHEKP
jgi:hypothetical protein